MKRVRNKELDMHAPVSKTMRMTRMKRVLGEIEQQGRDKKRMRHQIEGPKGQVEAETLNLERKLKHKLFVDHQTHIIKYQEILINNMKAEMLVGKQVIERLIDHIKVLEANGTARPPRFAHWNHYIS